MANRRTTQSSDRWLGQDFGGYRTDHCVFVGTWARTYAASAIGNQAVENAAVKIYPPVDGAPSERGLREQRVLGSLEHACITRRIDAGTREEATYSITKWIDGITLHERLRAGHLKWPELKPILHALGRALAAVHNAGFVHRDIKPSNVVVTLAGSAVLLDFSHALDLGAIARGDARLTDRGLILGSASFMAPEQARGGDLDGRADLYSLGVLLYQCLTGVLPFDDASPARAMERHLSEPVVPPRQRAPQCNISESLDHLAMWLLAKSVRDRLPSALVLLHTLQTIT